MIPHNFILDFLYPLPLRTKQMFGVVSIYSGDKIYLATRKNEKNPIDNGIWIASKVEHHDELKQLIPELRPIQTYSVKAWLVLHDEEENFEEQAQQLADLIKANSPLIGSVPKPRKSKSRKK